MSNSAGPGPAGSVVANGRQGHKYLGLLNETTKQLECKVQVYQQILNDDQSKLESGDQIDDASGLLTEDTKGKIRSAIGKAKLLLDKKFSQFQELCHKNLNEDESASFRTLDDDLAGFWDLVSIQVNNVEDLFDEIDQLKKNNWQPLNQNSQDHIPEIVKTFKKVEINQIESTNNHATTKAPATKNAQKIKDDEERRRKLREAKQKAAAQLKSAGQDGTDESISIFIASKPDVARKNGS